MFLSTALHRHAYTKHREGVGGLASDWVNPHALFTHFPPHTLIKINACISLQASVRSLRQVMEAAGSSCARWTGWETKNIQPYAHFQSSMCARTVTQTRSLAQSETNHATHTHAHKNRPTLVFKERGGKKGGGTNTQSYYSFPSNPPTYKVKKETQK